MKDEQTFHDDTLQYYEDHAEEFTANTIDADMQDIRGRFLSYLPAGARILDFGCGTGRDSKAFHELGYEVSALDGSKALCRIAGELTSLPVRCLDFRQFTPEKGELYDGIWACASLLHLKKAELVPVMHALGKALSPEGILYVSFKYGDYEGERYGRYFTDFTLEGFRDFMGMLPEFMMAEHWLTGDVRPGRGEQQWLNIILRKTDTN